MKETDELLSFKSDTYSQFGEDGVIKRIFEIIPVKDKYCIEFGAWDGDKLSNTKNLIENNYSAILIEGSKKRANCLRKNYLNNPNVSVINEYVGFNDDNNLDEILRDTIVPKGFDFLSIDVDGNNYHIWKVMSKYKPKVVCIEYNLTIPNEIEFIQKADMKVNQGSSILSIVKLGKDKGYELVCCTKANAFFVRKEFFPYFKIEDNSIQNIRTDLSSVTYLFSGYDGKVFLYGKKKLQGHYDLELSTFFMQPIPKFLRKFPENYNVLEWVLFVLYFVIYHLLTTPYNFFSRILGYLKRSLGK